MNRQQLFEEIIKKKSFLCIGLDTDLTKIPKHLLGLEDPMFEFNKQIVDATHHLAIAYKPNLAFYEMYGSKGWMSLEKTVCYIRSNYPEIFIIADAKRGDIGNTSTMYAKAFLDNTTLPFDAVTVAPYMGEDSIVPFLAFPGKWVILLALTSNKGAADFQLQYLESEETHWEYVYEKVLKTSQNWGTINNMMYVVGATKAEKLVEIRNIVPDHFLLVPGVGAQGGSLEEVAEHGMNDSCGLLVNSSRNIIYASNGEDFAEAAAQAALTDCQQPMEKALRKKGLI